MQQLRDDEFEIDATADYQPAGTVAEVLGIKLIELVRLSRQSGVKPMAIYGVPMFSRAQALAFRILLTQPQTGQAQQPAVGETPAANVDLKWN